MTIFTVLRIFWSKHANGGQEWGQITPRHLTGVKHGILTLDFFFKSLKLLPPAVRF